MTFKHFALPLKSRDLSFEAKKAQLSLFGQLGKREGICHNRAGNWANASSSDARPRKWQGEM